jgi:hypothetical protein
MTLTGAPQPMRWGQALLDQLTWHYEHHVVPRLAGLSDDEYFWEPVEVCWSIRPRSQARTALASGAGELVADFEYPEPDPPPLTTIAWRLAHVRIGVFAMRNAAHFGAPAIDYATAFYPEHAAEALAGLQEAYQTWVAGVAKMDDEALARPIGPAEPFPDAPFAALVLHIHREAIHHLSEVLLLRDLYRNRS